MSRRTWLLLAIAVVLAGVGVRLHRKPVNLAFPLVRSVAPEVEPTAPLQPVFPVAVELARVATVHESTSCTGVVLPSSEETLVAPRDGVVKAVKVKLGAAVVEDDVLAVLVEAEPSPSPSPSPRAGSTPAPDLVRLDGEIQIAQKDIQAAEADVLLARTAVEKAQADEAAQLKVLEQDKQLLANGAIARNDYDNDLDAASRAQALTSQAQDHLSQTQQAVVRQRQMLEREQGLRLTVMTAARPRPVLVLPPINLSDFQGRIKAGVPGVVLKCFIKPGQKVHAKAPLFKLGRLDMVLVRAHVGSVLMKDIKVGAVVNVSAEGLPYSLQAELSKTAPDGTLEALVANPGRKLGLGAVVQVQVQLGEHDNVVTIPAAALVKEEGRTVVWIAHRREAETVAIQVPVEPGVRDGDRLEIIEGLQPGDEVIWKGAEELQNGVLVHANDSDSGTEAVPGSTESPCAPTPDASSSPVPGSEASCGPEAPSDSPSSSPPKDTGSPE